MEMKAECIGSPTLLPLQIYLVAVGDRHGDAVLIGDVVGAVIWGARAGPGGAATCRV